MKHTRLLTTNPSRPIIFYPPKVSSNLCFVYGRAQPPGLGLPVACLATHDTQMTAASPANISDVGSSGVLHESLPTGTGKSLWWEETLEKVIYNCRFMALLAVMGSLIGSVLCFIKGCAYVVSSYHEYFVNQGRGIFMLVEATDVYLLGTVMLVFGMGLFELFISNLDVAKSTSEEATIHRSNLFGLFALKERPKWLEIKSVNELKTKLGHVIVMLLLIGLFEKSKKAAILTPTDLLCFSGCVLLSSGCLYLLSKLH